jgi:guanylate kinase
MAGKLFVIAAPSGAGKTSLVASLIKDVSALKVSISHTTRPKRPGEVDGENYFFVDDATFNKMVEDNAFLEHATVFDYAYGTSAAWVKEQLAQDIDVILEIDWQGARQVRPRFADAVTVFIVPPSHGALNERLKNRQQDAPEVIQQRMAKAQSEMTHAAEFDYLVVNDDFGEALADLKAIVRSRRLKMVDQQIKHQKLLAELLA